MSCTRNSPSRKAFNCSKSPVPRRVKHPSSQGCGSTVTPWAASVSARASGVILVVLVWMVVGGSALLLASRGSNSAAGTAWASKSTSHWGWLYRVAKSSGWGRLSWARQKERKMPLTRVGERGFLLLRRTRFTDSFTAARGGILSSMVI